MLGTLVAIVFSFGYYFFPFEHPPGFFLLNIFLGLPFLTVPPFLYLSALKTLRKSEDSSLATEDPILLVPLRFLLVVPLFFLLPLFSKAPFIATLLIAGISIDLFAAFFKRLAAYFNPSKMLALFVKQAVNAWQKKELKTWQNLMNELSQKVVRALEKNSIPLALQQLEAMASIEAALLEKAPPNEQEMIPFSIGVLMENLHAIEKKIFELKNTIALDHLLALMNKLLLKAARVDLNFALVPLHYVKAWTLEAIPKLEGDTSIKVTLGLVEVFKELSLLKDFQKKEIKTLGVPLLMALEEISKETFKKNKSVQFTLLLAPFQEIGGLVEKPPYNTHPDTSFLKQQLRRIMEEFAALETVMLTVPPQEEK
jgi:hypothetical protein